MYTSVVTRNGQIKIPASLRDKLGIHQGSEVTIVETPEGLVIRPVSRSRFEAYAGLLGSEGKATKALLDARQHEQSHENRRP